MAVTIESLEKQIEEIINTMQDPSEYEIDGAIKIKNKVQDKIMALNALQLQLQQLQLQSTSPVSTILNRDYESL
jgi:hypothetical protein